MTIEESFQNLIAQVRCSGYVIPDEQLELLRCAYFGGAAHAGLAISENIAQLGATMTQLAEQMQQYTGAGNMDLRRFMMPKDGGQN